MQQAFVQPFEESELSSKEQAKRKILRLLGNKKKMQQLEESAVKQVIYDQSDSKGKFAINF
jgi:hypothetical protein